MILRKIELTDYRNIEKCLFNPCEGVTIVCGDNGQGKTNLLEAVYMLTGARSFRSAKDKDLIKKDSERALINGDIFAGQRKQNIKICIENGGGRTASLNGGERVRASSLAGVFTCVAFSPVQLSLVKNGPEERRRFADAAIMQLYPRYADIYRRYFRALAQKNALLKDAPYNPAALDLLEALDETLSNYAAETENMRRAFMKEITPEAREFYSMISDSAEELFLEYAGAPADIAGCELRDYYYEQYCRMRGEDIRLKSCSVGPHRADIIIKIKDMDARAYASQGQQRSAVLALKLAEGRLLKKAYGEEPVLLLDDLLGELDMKRQKVLLKGFEGSQAIVTCCDPRAVKELTGGKLVRVSNGVFTEE